MERHVRQQGLRGSGDPIGPHIYRTHIPFELATASDRLGWGGLQAARYSDVLDRPALSHHVLVPCIRPAEKLEVRCEGGVATDRLRRLGRSRARGQPVRVPSERK